MNKPTVTLCMIVKDETHIIEQCLRSMVKHIDRYDITDTGATDGTQDLIKKVMDESGIPGEIHQSDWKGFGDHAGQMGSRTESLINAKKNGADYAWVIDADDYVDGNFSYPEPMDADAYSLQIGRDDFVWWRNQIFNLKHNWKYVGILHEYATCEVPPDKIINTKLNGDYRIFARTEGNRNIGITPKEKYTRDAETILSALKDEPGNERYHFYLAQSYFDSQQWEKAAEAYQTRVDMGGWPEEVYYSMLRVALIKGIMEKPFNEIQDAFLNTYNFRPTRAEPLWFLARMNRMNDRPVNCFMFARHALEIEYPQQDILFIQNDVYKWGLLDEIGATAYYAGRPDMGLKACAFLMENKEKLNIPREHWERIQSNLTSYNELMGHIEEQKTQATEKTKLAENAKNELVKQRKKLEKTNKANTPKMSTKTPSVKDKYKKREKTKA